MGDVHSARAQPFHGHDDVAMTGYCAVAVVPQCQTFGEPRGREQQPGHELARTGGVDRGGAAPYGPGHAERQLVADDLRSQLTQAIEDGLYGSGSGLLVTGEPGGAPRESRHGRYEPHHGAGETAVDLHGRSY